MSISVKTRKILWGRAANRCAMPDCRNELVISVGDEQAGDEDPSVIAEECHITSRKTDGARHDPALSPKQRDEYDNLILLCRNHHVEVDYRPDVYGVEDLKNMRKNHESWVRENLNVFEADRQRNDEVYAGYVDEWVDRAALDDWEAWASGLTSFPCLAEARKKELEALRSWMLTRIWPGTYSDLESAFHSFCMVLNDILDTMNQYGETVKRGSSYDILIEKRYQKLQVWDDEVYNRLVREYEMTLALLAELTKELTKTANLICDLVRRHLLPVFRREAGYLSISGGPDTDFKFYQCVPLYPPNVDAQRAYCGLAELKKRVAKSFEE
jgi:hypothetical protein